MKPKIRTLPLRKDRLDYIGDVVRMSEPVL
jgi:hypothetical protein